MKQFLSIDNQFKIYFSLFQDAPPEEANIVEKILSHRERPPRDEHERAKYGDRDVEEFLVKYKN